MRASLTLLCTAMAVTGCTHTQLAYNTSNQASSVADVQTQQILDNLARFVHNPNALPYYSFPTAGASDVNDSGNGMLGFNFNPFGLTSWSLGTNGSRSMRESYTMNPVNDPRKLELIRCAFQRAIAGCYPCGTESVDCPNCNKRFNEYYLGTPSPGQVARVTHEGHQIYALLGNSSDLENYVEIYAAKDSFGDEKYYSLTDGSPVDLDHLDPATKKELVKPMYVYDSLAEATLRSGRVTSECLHSPCWFHVGKKCDVPKWCDCKLVGEYCGTYVWVPECGRDQLTKLTLTVLDIAVNDPADPPKAAEVPKKEVTIYLNEDFQYSNRDEAAFKITGTIKASEKADSLVKPEQEAKEKIQPAKERFQEAANNFRNEWNLSFGQEKQFGGLAQQADGRLKSVEDIRAAVDFVLNSLTDEKIKPLNLKAEITSRLPRFRELAKEFKAADSQLDATRQLYHRAESPSPIPPAPASQGLPDRRPTPIPGFAPGILQYELYRDTLTPDRRGP